MNQQRTDKTAVASAGTPLKGGSSPQANEPERASGPEEGLSGELSAMDKVGIHLLRNRVFLYQGN